MAGEFEDPVSFQVDSLPTGSISFGKFEAESLCWERRSSFSHNRYLEEVEKCSKPGSVDEKKAYFEAHFKRKFLPAQSGTECQTRDGDMMIHIDYKEKCGCQVDESIHCMHFDEIFEDTDEQDYVVMEFRRTGEETSYYELQTESEVPDGEGPLDTDDDQIDPNEIFKTREECDTQLPAHDGVEIEIEENLPDNDEKYDLIENAYPETEAEAVCTEVENQPNDEVEDVEKLLELKSVPERNTNSRGNRSSNSRKLQKPSSKATMTTEQSTIASKVGPHLPASQTNKITSKEKTSLSSVKVSNKAQRKIERQNEMKTKTERESTSKVPQTAISTAKNIKSEECKNTIAKSSQVNGSEKDIKLKKSSASSQPPSRGSENEKHQQAFRYKRNSPLTKTELKPTGLVFNFKSDERAERRKQFYLKLEEKMHAKEEEKNQIQAKTQEQAETEIKQFRKSLNFKATPMPSFYLETAPRGSLKKQVVTTTHSKSTKSGPPMATEKPVCPGKPRGTQGTDNSPDASEAETPATSRPNWLDKINETVNANCTPKGSRRCAGSKNETDNKAGSLDQPEVPKKGDSFSHRALDGKGRRPGTGRSKVAAKVMKGVVGGGPGMSGSLVAGVCAS